MSSECLEERGASPPLRLLPRRWEKPFLGAAAAAAPAEKRESLKLRFIINPRNESKSKCKGGSNENVNIIVIVIRALCRLPKKRRRK